MSGPGDPEAGPLAKPAARHLAACVSIHTGEASFPLTPFGLFAFPTLLAQSHGPAGRLMPTPSLSSSNHTGEASFPLDHFGYSGRAVEYAVSRPNNFYRFSLTVEYIF